MENAVSRSLGRIRSELVKLAGEVTELEAVISDDDYRSPTEKEIIYIEEMASIARVSTMTIYRWIKKGKLQPIHRQGKRYYWLRSELDEVLKSAN